MKDPQRLIDLDPDAAELLRAAAEVRASRRARRRLLRILVLPAALSASVATGWALAAKTVIAVCGAALMVTAATGAIIYHAGKRPARAPNVAPTVAKMAAAPAETETATVIPAVAPAFAAAGAVPRTSAAAVRPRAKMPAAAPSSSEVARSILARELLLLNAAKIALQEGQSRQALRLLDEYARVFPAGTLGDESTVLRILANRGSGDLARARAEGDAFVRAHPHSVLRERVRALIVELQEIP